jgi:hypothetical protein
MVLLGGQCVKNLYHPVECWSVNFCNAGKHVHIYYDVTPQPGVGNCIG